MWSYFRKKGIVDAGASVSLVVSCTICGKELKSNKGDVRRLIYHLERVHGKDVIPVKQAMVLDQETEPIGGFTKFFTKLGDGSNKCNLCGKSLKWNRSTHGMKYYVEKVHGILLKDP